MKIVGISGSNGSGKDTIGHMLEERYGWLFVSVTELLRQEAKRRNLPVEREVLRTISAQWRREGGLGVLIDKAIEEHKAELSGYAGLAIASLRNPGEADRVHELGGTVVWVDADVRIRYNRIFARHRTIEDEKTFEEFVAEEAAEMHASGDAATLDLSAVHERADIEIFNNGADIDKFKDSAAVALAAVA